MFLYILGSLKQTYFTMLFDILIFLDDRHLETMRGLSTKSNSDNVFTK